MIRRVAAFIRRHGRTVGIAAAGLLLAMVLIGLAANVIANAVPDRPDRLVPAVDADPGGDRRTLFVLVHGMDGNGAKTWAPARAALAAKGDVLALNFPGFPLSNADPDDIARGIRDAVQNADDASARRGASYGSIVLVGHSMGALLVRKAYLFARGDAGREAKAEMAPWAQKVQRIVLMAGTNRGWSVRQDRPLDQSMWLYVKLWAGSWLGRLTGTGTLIRQMETGAPFVSNLRLEWMRAFRDGTPRPVVVQLLGDIDDIVSDEDNKDVRIAGASGFVWLRVRGTGHPDIVKFDDPTREAGGQKLGEYRREKFLAAATGDLAALRWQNEEQPFQTDDGVTHVVFILHGIRDLGRWSAHFEPPLVDAFASTDTGARGKLAIASVRYGYFGMLPFLFRWDRQRYVRWFMDQYTETLARYPNAKHIQFVGHSNGTYVLTSALARYHSMQIDRVVLAGSVVRRGFEWAPLIDRKQVGLVRNYVAADDAVVALFPRLFELPGFRWLGNDIGSAGFNGFDRRDDPRLPHVRVADVVRNVAFIYDGHSAFKGHLKEIVDFLLRPPDAVNVDVVKDARHGAVARVLKPLSDFAPWLAWLILLGAVVLVMWGLRRVIPHRWRWTRLAAQAAWLVLVGIVLYKV